MARIETLDNRLNSRITIKRLEDYAISLTGAHWNDAMSGSKEYSHTVKQVIDFLIAFDLLDKSKVDTDSSNG